MRMKNYLELASISAKVRKDQNRMTVFCIIFSVFLVMTIFGMADMEIRTMRKQAKEDYGEWHIAFRGMDDEQMEILAGRPEIETCSRYDVLNYRLDMHYRIEGEEALIAGLDRTGLDVFGVRMQEGVFPEEPGEVMIDADMKKRLGLTVGSRIVLSGPDGTEFVYQVTGILEQTPMLAEKGVFGLIMNMEGFRNIRAKEGEERESLIYVKFLPWCNIRKAEESIRDQFGIPEDKVSGNELLLATMGQSDDPTILILYGAALFLSILAAVAGVLMISSSMNSYVVRRTEFFGLLSCLGAERKQISRLVRKEALGWCRIAVPAGIGIGTGIIWLLCAFLRLTNPEYFGKMPGFGISWIGMACGAAVGVASVLMAARAPAKRAAKVSPLEAVSGNAHSNMGVRKAAGKGFGRIETALGIHHALYSGKNFILTTSSFAFSIILFLAFATTVDFMGHALNGLQPYTPDISLIGQEGDSSMDGELGERISKIEGVKRVYGRMFAYDVPVEIRGEKGSACIISYEDYQFGWAKEDLVEGSFEEAVNGRGMLAVFRPDQPVREGDVLQIDTGNGGEEFAISGVLSQCPFNSADGEVILICSESTFQGLTGEEDYTIIDIQLNRRASNTTIDEIRALAGDDVHLSDRRMKNRQAKGAMYSVIVFVYGFLAVIALITVFHVINIIAMSVSARMRQYGAMRAVGMECAQMEKMIVAEAGTYALWGMIIGCGAGLPVNRILYYYMVTVRWGEEWTFPTASLAVILIVVAVSLAAAVHHPVRRVRRMSVVETIIAK